jgi:hypothetical protein
MALYSRRKIKIYVTVHVKVRPKEIGTGQKKAKRVTGKYSASFGRVEKRRGSSAELIYLFEGRLAAPVM